MHTRFCEKVGLKREDIEPAWHLNPTCTLPYKTWETEVLKLLTHVQWKERLQAAGIEESRLRAQRKADLFRSFTLTEAGEIIPAA
eukprot:14711523-Alexandrium_andersonii.AAC.1